MGPFSQTDQEALAELIHHWGGPGGAYDIAHTPLWLAARRDGRGAIYANTPGELMEKISADYAACPVPRDLS